MRHAHGVLLDARALLVAERGRGVELLPAMPSEWLGRSLAVHDIPLRPGGLSYALRWHGARPALLWNAPPGLTLRIPRLDPAWSSTEAVGEALLGELDEVPESFA